MHTFLAFLYLLANFYCQKHLNNDKEATFLSAAAKTYDYKKHDAHSGESLGRRNGEPGTRYAPCEGEHRKAEYKEDVATQGSEHGGPSATLDTLEVAYHGDVDGKEE